METTPDKKRHSRRSALKTIITGTGVATGLTALPGKWVKPMVDIVLVPAHAEISPSCRVLRSDELKIIRLDCSMELFEKRMGASIDDETNPRCPKLLIGESGSIDIWYSVETRRVGKILDIAFVSGLGSFDNISQLCNDPSEWSSGEYDYPFHSFNDDVWVMKGIVSKGLNPIPYLELSDIHFVPKYPDP